MENKNNNYAQISASNLEMINSVQGQIKTAEGKDVILIAYEK